MIIFDTETTGLPLPLSAPLSSQPHIIEFAALKVDDKTFASLDEIHFMVNPGILLEDKITKITGITNDDLKGKETFSFYYDQLVKFFENETIIVAHNASFDVKMLQFELKRIDKLDYFVMPQTIICTVIKSMYLKGYRLKLAELYQTLCEKEIKGAHRAINDVRALTECVKVMHKQNRL